MSKPYKYPLKYQAWRMITKNRIIDSVNSVTGYFTISSREDPYYVRIASSYGKKIYFAVKITVKDSAPVQPAITEMDDEVRIICSIPRGYSTIDYWNQFLLNPSSENNYNELIKYVKPFSALEGESSWPACTIPEDTPINVPLVSVTNNGGIAPHQASVAEIVGRFNDPDNIEYNVRYIRKLKPIILVDLTDIDNELSIEGYQEPMESELPSELHEDIL